jgi:type IV secretion system protein VirD4
MTANIKKYILPNLPYALVFWFFAKCGEGYRLSPKANAIYKLMDCIGNLDVTLSRPPLSFVLSDLCVGLIGAAAVFCVVLYRKMNAKKWRKDIEYGSARWGSKKDIAPYVDPLPENNLILTATEGLMLNGRPMNPKYARNKNVLVVGGSGSGKTRFFLKPNLM